jgi:hypothetical protein
MQTVLPHQQQLLDFVLRWVRRAVVRSVSDPWFGLIFGVERLVLHARISSVNTHRESLPKPIKAPTELLLKSDIAKVAEAMQLTLYNIQSMS